MQWTVKRSHVACGSGNQHGITSWYAYMDGCASAVVLPHMTDCLERLDIAGRVCVGKLPFFYVIDLPYAMASGSEVGFAELLSQRTIQGDYYDEAQLAGLLGHCTPVKIDSIRREGGAFSVEFIATTARPIGLTGSARSYYGPAIEVQDSHSQLIKINAKDDNELASHLRLAATILHLRWDPRSEVNRTFFGEPLI